MRVPERQPRASLRGHLGLSRPRGSRGAGSRRHFGHRRKESSDFGVLEGISPTEIGGERVNHNGGGALRLTRAGFDTNVVAADAPGLQAALAQPHLAVLVWEQRLKRIHVLPREPDVSYIHLSLIPPLWQLGEGWIGSDPNFRWIAPRATARLLPRQYRLASQGIDHRRLRARFAALPPARGRDNRTRDDRVRAQFPPLALQADRSR